MNEQEPRRPKHYENVKTQVVWGMWVPMSINYVKHYRLGWMPTGITTDAEQDARCRTPSPTGTGGWND